MAINLNWCAFQFYILTIGITITIKPPVSRCHNRKHERVQDKLKQAAQSIEVAESFTSLAGYNLSTGLSGARLGMGMVNLKSWKEREESRNYTEIGGTNALYHRRTD